MNTCTDDGREGSSLTTSPVPFGRLLPKPKAARKGMNLKKKGLSRNRLLEFLILLSGGLGSCR